MANTLIKPFLRWAGGKSRIIRHLLECLPEDPYQEYWEPFLGSAALFFAIKPETAHLSDSNPDLVACYGQVRDRPEVVYRSLRTHLQSTSEEYYYEMRRQYNRCRLTKRRRSAAQAARFIYLNRTSFNGIFRVNREGNYNVPYGFKEPPPAPDWTVLQTASRLLQGASLSDEQYYAVLAGDVVRAGDLVYLDPPYPPLARTANFTHYTASRFSWNDQQRVRAVADGLRKRGCFVMISNTSIEPIRELYAGWHLHELPVTRWVAANGSRRKVADLVITSYRIHT